MQVYLVGGAVRDGLLGRAIKDKDFVVVGADASDMLALGFVQVGADFPVFLHPKTHHEYALARLERKTGVGHTAFSVQSGKEVSLKEDLLRRDLTINALAIQVKGLFDDTPITGEVVDYYGGLTDLNVKVLRHVSPAFSEDPLRVLRVARFYARFFELGFVVCETTAKLMQTLAQSGELASLSRERLWSESSRAMGEKNGFAYWQLLYDLQILPFLLPSLNNNWQDEFVRQQVFECLKKSYNHSSAYQFAMLMSGFVHDQNKQAVDDCAYRLCVPKNAVQLANLLLDFAKMFNRSWGADDVMALLERTKAYQNLALAMELIQLCQTYWACFGGFDEPLDFFENFKNKLSDFVKIYQSIGIEQVDKSLKGREIGQMIYQLRVQKIAEFLQKGVV